MQPQHTMVVFSDFDLDLYKTQKLENDKNFNIEKHKNLFPLTLASVPMNASTSKTLPRQSNHYNNVLVFLGFFGFGTCTIALQAFGSCAWSWKFLGQL